MKSIVDKIPKSCETFVHSKRAPMRFSVVLEMFSLTLELKSCNPKDLKLPFTSPIVYSGSCLIKGVKSTSQNKIE